MTASRKECLNGIIVSQPNRTTHDTGTLLTLPETTIDTLLDLREDGGELGDVLCAGLDEIMRFLIEESIDTNPGEIHLTRLQTLMTIRCLIDKLSK